MLRLTIIDTMITKRLAKMEKDNNLSPGGIEGYLLNFGSDKETLETRMRADLTWLALVSKLFKDKNKVTEQEIDNVIADTESNKTIGGGVRRYYFVKDLVS